MKMAAQLQSAVVQREGPTGSKEKAPIHTSAVTEVSRNTLLLPGKWSKSEGEVLWMIVPPGEGEEDGEVWRNIDHL